MAYVTAKVKKWGHSFGITIPKHIAKDAELFEDDVVNIHIVKKKKVSGLGICKGKGAFEEEKEKHREL
ncbi:MAG: AbrB/MazE/SpoVT family DNA-binding domain-containing protein [Candidatus Thermoplasmatota archaeon]